MELPDPEVIKRKVKGRNPDLSRDETVLLMDLYLSAPDASERHPEVIALSAVLRAAAKAQGRATLPTFRNPAGIALRLRNFGKLDPQAPAERHPGIRPGGAMDRRVWREFGTARAALASEVDRIRKLMVLGGWTQFDHSSHGPVPYFGSYTVDTTDESNGVYLVVIDGPLEVLAPKATPRDGYRVVKLGRTVDLERRVCELTSGLPPTSQIRYLPIGLRIFSSGNDAHRFERNLLDLCDREAWSLGGEFAYAPLSVLKTALSSSRGASDPF